MFYKIWNLLLVYFKAKSLKQNNIFSEKLKLFGNFVKSKKLKMK